MAIGWSDEYSTGSVEIDNQHKELITRFNNFLEACKSRKGAEEGERMLKFLEEYVVFHFETEEKFMKQYQYPDTQKHAADHKEFINSMQAFKKEVRDEGMNVSVVISLSKAIMDWLIKHIGTMDKALGAFLKTKMPQESLK